MTPPGTRFEPWRQIFGYEAAILPGCYTGAAPTADRLYHAQLTDSQWCRWCGATKETIQHVTSESEGVFAILGRPFVPMDDQPMLATHGICEVP